MHESETSHLAVSKHQRPPIWTEEAAGFHKRVKRIHDHVKIVVPCVVFEAEFPIPPDRKETTSIDTGYHQTTPQMQYRTTLTSWHRSMLPLLHRSTLGPYQSRRSSMCVEVFLTEKPPHDQTSLGERRGGIGRREKRLKAILGYH
ncbi:hypothetical protein YC2023_098414 [Brassica napus]